MKNLLKRTIALVLAFIMCFCLVACGEIAHDTQKETENIDKSEQINEISHLIPEYAREGILYKDILKAYGFDESFSYIDNPKNKDEYFNNFTYAFLMGEYIITDQISYDAKMVLRTGSMKPYLMTHADLWGPFINLGATIYEINGQWYVQVDNAKNIPFSASDLHNQMIDAYLEAVKNRDQAKQQGFVKDDFTTKEKVKGYLKYYKSLGIVYDTTVGSEKWNNEFGPLKDDTAYGALNNKLAVCVGFAGGFSLILHSDNIDSFVVLHEVDPTHNHASVYFIDEGKEYLVDPTNFLNVDEITTYCKKHKMRMFTEYLNEVRSEAQNKLKTEISFANLDDYQTLWATWGK